MTAPNVAKTADGARESEHGVTLWGAPGAGKSGLLGALYAASLRAEADGWSAHPKDCEDEYTQERMKDAYLGLLGRSNAKTDLPAAGEYQPLRLTLRRRTHGAMRVALVDPAGEFSTQLELGTTRDGRALFSRMARGAGVLWLFEPRGVAADESSDDASDVATRMLTLQHLVALLEQSGAQQLAIPVALCLSKVDCLGDAARDAARVDPAKALREHLGDTAFTWFEAVCPTMRCFAISSAGTVQGQVKPEGLDDVFDWLAESTTHHVTMRERMNGVLGAVPPLRSRFTSALRGALGALSSVAPSTRRIAKRTVVATAAVGALSGVVAFTGGRAAWAARLAPPLHALESIPRALASRRATNGATPTTSTPVANAPAPNAPSPNAPDPVPVERGGEVLGPMPERLARARALADAGAWSDALGSLAGVTPPSAGAMRFTWDSLYIVAAMQAAHAAQDAAVARRLHASVRERATELLRRGPAGSTKLLGVRYARAVACVDGHLACSPREVRDDLTWALLGSNAMRRGARERLASLGASEVTP